MTYNTLQPATYEAAKEAVARRAVRRLTRQEGTKPRYGLSKNLTFEEALQKRLEKRAREAGKPVQRHSRLKAGRRMKEWKRVWAWLKPRLEARGRTGCEFDFIPHECWGRLDPCHATKRGKMQGDDIYRVAIGCQQVHVLLDEKYEHETMYVAVNYAITRAGGIVTPATEAAQKEKRAA